MSEVAAPADTGGQGTGTPSTSAAIVNTAASPQTVSATSTSQVAATPAPVQPANQTIDWLTGADELTLGYTANKGWKDPSEVVRSYQNLEKLMGADKAGNAIVVPKADADPKEWGAVYDRLGRPANPDGYKVSVPEGGDAEFQKGMLTVAHEAGLSQAQAEKLFGTFNERALAAMAQQQQAKVAQFQQDEQSIRTEWGAAYTQNLAQAQAAARFLGIDAATIDKISDSLGHKGTMQLLQKIGSRSVESEFVDGGADKPGFSSVMSPAQAKSEIKSLAEDKNFRAKLIAKDADALRKWDQLHQWAHPEQR